MAAFDHIEFFGIGHGRNITIVRQARSRSGSSLCLSAAGTQSPTAIEQSPRQWPSQPNITWKASPSSSFTNLTPESVYGQPPRNRSTLFAPESPVMSENPSWRQAGNEPSSLEEYVSRHERHELIALALPAGLKKTYHSSIPDRSGPTEFNALREPRPGSPEVQSTHSQTPMNRYLGDVLQTHERLSLALGWPDQTQGLATLPGSDEQPACSSYSTISLSDGVSAREEGEEASGSGRMLIAQFYRERRERVFSRGYPRQFKVQQIRKRPSESPGQGHKEKRARMGLM
ncbi:hypothetical protein VTI74DRAFT_9617 [Chaetomium olivicolor]